LLPVRRADLTPEMALEGGGGEFGMPGRYCYVATHLSGQWWHLYFNI
jgi:hypothetical protein